MKDRSIDHIDEAGYYNGYQEWYSAGCKVYWYRGNMFHGDEIGYVEQNMSIRSYVEQNMSIQSVEVGDEGTEVLYYII